MGQTMTFTPLARQQFRAYFQPSRILLGVVPSASPTGVNVITLCFSMHCSYDPPMLAVAVYHKALSCSLLTNSREYVLAVPGESLASAAMLCGTSSGRDIDKVEACGLETGPGVYGKVPILMQAIANVEITKTAEMRAGDHVLFIGEAKSFLVNAQCRERPLVSFGPRDAGYTLLAREGIHRIGVVGASLLSEKSDGHQI